MSCPHNFPAWPRTRHAVALLTAAVMAASALLSAAQAAPYRAAGARLEATDRIIIKWRSSGVAESHIQDPIARTASLSRISGLKLTALRAIHDHLDVVRLDAPRSGAALQATLVRLRNDPFVEYAEPDAKRYIVAFPTDAADDPHFIAGSDAAGRWEGQWYLKEPAADPIHGASLAAVGATTAWKIASGASQGPTLGDGQIIAVIDTGVDLGHPDLGVYSASGGGKLLPGRDFVCNDSGGDCLSTSTVYTYSIANDPTEPGWDADPTDPGDWISARDLSSGNFPASCGDPSVPDHHLDSNWHGTRVAGIAAAITDNGVGIAGVAPHALILPVRVIGKCSGFVSDIVAGMYWAAGLSNAAIAGVPPNPNPAQILNLSLGANSPCSRTEQAAVTAISQAGHLVVAAAGNDGGPVGTPANCSGILSVAGLRHAGTKVGYSNVSSASASISIGAPAGNCGTVLGSRPWTLPCLYSIDATSNDGFTVPGRSTYTYSLLNQGPGVNYENEGTLGTSFAAPIVAGVAALMVQANAFLTADQLIARMRASATAFPVPAAAPAGGICHVANVAVDSKGVYTDFSNSQECQCTTATCGAGMLNAAAAVLAALAPGVSVVTSVDRASVGQSVTLDGSGSTAAPPSQIVSYYWASDPAVSITNASSAVAKLVFPALRPVTVTLTVTDDAGRQAQAFKTISGTEVSAGGGSGAMDLITLVSLCGAGLAAITSRRRRQAAFRLN